MEYGAKTSELTERQSSSRDEVLKMSSRVWEILGHLKELETKLNGGQPEPPTDKPPAPPSSLFDSIEFAKNSVDYCTEQAHNILSRLIARV